MDKPIDIERACKLVRDVAGALGVHGAGDMALMQATSLVLAHRESLQDRALKAEESVDRLTAEVARMQGEVDGVKANRDRIVMDRNREIDRLQSALDSEKSAHEDTRKFKEAYAKKAAAGDAVRLELAALRASHEASEKECERLVRERDAALYEHGVAERECEDAEDEAAQTQRELDAALARLKSAEDALGEVHSIAAEVIADIDESHTAHGNADETALRHIARITAPSKVKREEEPK